MNWDLNILKVFLQSDTNRKKTAFMMYYFLQNDVENIRDYLVTYGTQGKMFSQETMDMLPKIHRDTVNKVLNNICTAYNPGVDRYLVGADGEVDEAQTELLNELYDKAGINDAQKEWYRAGKLFNTIEVKTVWRKSTNQAEFDIWTPNFFSVWENPENTYLRDALIIDIKRIDDKGRPFEAQEFWSVDEHFYMIQQGTFTEDGKEKPIMKRVDLDGNNANFINPFKVIPSTTLRFKRGEDFFGIGMLDLVEETIWNDLIRSNNIYVLIFQGNGIIYAVNMGESDQIPLTPNRIITINGVKVGDEVPFIESVATNAPIAEMRDTLMQFEKDILTSKGLSGQTASTDNQNAPGISKALDLEEVEHARKEDKQILESFEEKNYNIFKTVHNTYGSQKLDPSNQLKFVCNIYDPKPSYNINDSIAKWKFELEIKAKTPIDYMIENDPNLDLEEAQKQYDKNKGFNGTPKPAPPTSQDNPSQT